MRTLHDKHDNMYIKLATSRTDVLRYLWKYHKISTDIAKSGENWFMWINNKLYGVGARSLDVFPIQHWATIYNWVKENPESNVSGMGHYGYEKYYIKNSKDITVPRWGKSTLP